MLQLHYLIPEPHLFFELQDAVETIFQDILKIQYIVSLILIEDAAGLVLEVLDELNELIGNVHIA